jgi:ATP-dependent 26S proteasome regulatory subunit
MLIMTTNPPKAPDSTFIRPGRIDLKVKFTLISHAQIRDIDKLMYNVKSVARASQTKPSKVARIYVHETSM